VAGLNSAVTTMNDQWISFGTSLPNVGDSIRIKFDDGTEFPKEYGVITSIRHIKDLGGNDCIYMPVYSENAWTLDSDKYIGSIVKDTYFWRLT
jgi:hypothetical protein